MREDALDVEKYGFEVTLHMDVEAVDRTGRDVISLRDQGCTPVFREARHDAIVAVQCHLIAEIDPRVGVRGQTTSEDAHVDVRCLVFVDPSWFDCLE